MGTDTLRGFVDLFDGERLGGWAFDESEPERVLSVDVYVDDLKVAAVVADQFRADLTAVSPHHPSKSFVHLFRPPLGSSRSLLVLPEVPGVTVKFAGTDCRLQVVPDLAGVVNVDQFNLAERFCVSADNRFLPTPDRDMLEHVAGASANPFSHRAVGMFLVLDLMQLGLLANPTCTVVDLGCGCGRLATQLAPYMADAGTYTGFDTWAAGVRWASEKITPLYPDFQFRELVAPGRAARDPGYVGETAYPLPVPDSSCDLVVASSVLTHLTYPAAAAYLKEFCRVLKPAGRAYVTFFFYDQEAEQLVANRSPRLHEHGAYFHHRRFFDTFFREESVAQMVADAGLRPILKRYGHWRGERYAHRRPIGAQDLLVLRRAGS